VPVSKAFWKRPPLAAIFRNVQHGIEHLQIRERYVTTLPREKLCDLSELFSTDFNDEIIPEASLIYSLIS
jgi:hypothetical protein